MFAHSEPPHPHPRVEHRGMHLLTRSMVKLPSGVESVDGSATTVSTSFGLASFKSQLKVVAAARLQNQGSHRTWLDLLGFEYFGSEGLRSLIDQSSERMFCNLRVAKQHFKSG